MSIAYAKEFLLIESFQQSEQYFEEITMANIDKKNNMCNFTTFM